MNALAHANFACEYNALHKSFIKKNTNRKYMEPHHLIPLSASELFEYSLDVEENIISLCSECHNRIHYGRDAKELIISLFNARKEYLTDVGIDITIEELLELYGWF